MAERVAQAGLTLPPMPPVGGPARQPTAHDVVYDIDPFGAWLPGATGLAGTAGEGLDVPATLLRSWAAGRAG